MHISTILAAFSSILLASAAPQVPAGWQAPVCTDGSQLYCCSATFSGDLAPVALASDLACYDLTPATTNCIITNAPVNPLEKCRGVWSCCQVNDLNPLLGLFCSEPPGECVGDEAPSRCLDVLNNRFGHCPTNNVANSDGGGLKLGDGGLLGIL